MRVFNRAFLSILRNKKRSLLLFLIIFILGCLLTSSIIIYKNTKKIENEIRNKLGVSATLIIDNDLIEKEIKEEIFDSKKQTLNTDLVEEIGSSSYVERFEYNIMGTVNPTEFEIVNDSDDDRNKSLFFHGINDPNLLDIENKKIKLSKGRLLSENEIQSSEGNGIISNQFAEINNIKINDRITLQTQIKQIGMDTIKADYLEIPIKVVGIFSLDNLSEGSKKKNREISSEQLNTIYFSNNFVKKINIQQNKIFNDLNPGFYTNDDGSIMSATDIEDLINIGMPIFKIKNYDNLQPFVEFSNNKLKNSYFKILTTDNQFQKIGSNITSINTISKYIIVGSFISCFTIIGLIVLLIIKYRTKEIAILLALGEQKKLVFIQLLLEILIITFIALNISVLTGTIVEKNISKFLLIDSKDQTTEINSTNNEDSFNTEEKYKLDKISKTIIYEKNLTELYVSNLSIMDYFFIIISLSLIIIVVSILSLTRVFTTQPKNLLFL